jgi:hypothetical protein
MEKIGYLASEFGRYFIPIEVCKSAAGYYIGTLTDDGCPFTRESEEYWPTWTEANNAMKSGAFTQRKTL